MAKAKKKKKKQDFAQPFSVLITKEHRASLDKVVDESGLTFSYLIRFAIADGLKRKIFDSMIAS